MPPPVVEKATHKKVAFCSYTTAGHPLPLPPEDVALSDTNSEFAIDSGYESTTMSDYSRLDQLLELAV
jgi:hypothetical protein